MRRQKTKDELDSLKREARAELHRKVYHGRIIREMLNSKAWEELVVPFLKEEEERLTKECRFDPLKGDVPSVERLAFLNSYNSGKIAMIDFIQSELSRISNDGEDSAKKLKQENQNENKMARENF